MVTLIQAKAEQLSGIANMAGVIWRAYYSAFLPSEQIEYMLGKFYALPSLQKQAEEGQLFYIIRYEDTDAGFVAISKKSETDYFIHKLYLFPELQGRHIGSAVMELINNMLCKDAGNGARFSIRLTVNRQNFKAVNFYFRNGFRIESVEDFDIGNDFYMNDFVMLKSLHCGKTDTL